MQNHGWDRCHVSEEDIKAESSERKKGGGGIKCYQKRILALHHLWEGG